MKKNLIIQLIFFTTPIIAMEDSREFHQLAKHMKSIPQDMAGQIALFTKPETIDQAHAVLEALSYYYGKHCINKKELQDNFVELMSKIEDKISNTDLSELINFYSTILNQFDHDSLDPNAYSKIEDKLIKHIRYKNPLLVAKLHIKNFSGVLQKLYALPVLENEKDPLHYLPFKNSPTIYHTYIPGRVFLQHGTNLMMIMLMITMKKNHPSFFIFLSLFIGSLKFLEFKQAETFHLINNLDYSQIPQIISTCLAAIIYSIILSM